MVAGKGGTQIPDPLSKSSGLPQIVQRALLQAVSNAVVKRGGMFVSLSL